MLAGIDQFVRLTAAEAGLIQRPAEAQQPIDCLAASSFRTVRGFDDRDLQCNADVSGHG